MKTLDQIAREVKACTKCPLHRWRANAVPGEGNARAEILFIGEGPGTNEDKEGRPFVGEAGQFLESMLKSVKLKREEVYITNVVKCRPPNNRDPLDEEVRICTTNYLYDQIRNIKPKMIVTLGRHSMHQFFPQIRSISAAHGKAYKKAGQVYLIFYHPAAALYQQNLKNTLKDDFKKIPEILRQIDETN